MKIDIESLRYDIIDYYGTAMNSGFPMAVIELGQIQNASADEIINFAMKLRIDLDKYIEEDDLER